MNIQELHRQAMEFADQAFCADLNGDQTRARVAWRRAFELEREAALLFELERQAALLFEDGKSAEPTRSVLFRSAASLALDCGEPLEARRLIEKALSGNPPDAIAAELRALFQQAESQCKEEQRHSQVDIEKLLAQIKSLTQEEASYVLNRMEESFSLSTTATAQQSDDAGVAAAPATKEREAFDVVINTAGANEINVVKVVRELTGLGLKEARDLVNSAPKTLKEGIPKDEAEAIKHKLAAAGASVEIR